MMYVYEMSPCIYCRDKLVKLMQELAIFPAWAAEESRWDCLRED